MNVSCYLFSALFFFSQLRFTFLDESLDKSDTTFRWLIRWWSDLIRLAHYLYQKKTSFTLVIIYALSHNCCYVLKNFLFHSLKISYHQQQLVLATKFWFCWGKDLCDVCYVFCWSTLIIVDQLYSNNLVSPSVKFIS